MWSLPFVHAFLIVLWSVCGACAPYKDGLSRYEDFHYKDETVVRPSYLYNGNSYTGKTTPLYWDGPRMALGPRRTNKMDMCVWNVFMIMIQISPYVFFTTLQLAMSIWFMWWLVAQKATSHDNAGLGLTHEREIWPQWVGNPSKCTYNEAYKNNTPLSKAFGLSWKQFHMGKYIHMAKGLMLI